MKRAGTKKSTALELLLALIDRGYDYKSWHGPNLKGAIRRVDLATAAYRPGPKRHNIWEIVLHAAYWKYVAWRRLTGERRGSFPLKGSNWFARPVESTERAWREDLALLARMHDQLRGAVAVLPSDQVHWRPSARKVSNFELIAGIAAHDVYHAGQIQLLKRLAGGDAS
jgi:uncharacterized damage-inducible protein DinB